MQIAGKRKHSLLRCADLKHQARPSDHEAVRFGHFDRGRSFQGYSAVRPARACSLRGFTFYISPVRNQRECARKGLIPSLPARTFDRTGFL
jgi:hypothetical protein